MPHRSPLYWDDAEELITLRPELVQETIEKIMVIKEKLNVIQTRHKSYMDPKRHEVEFIVGSVSYNYRQLNSLPKASH